MGRLRSELCRERKTYFSPIVWKRGRSCCIQWQVYWQQKFRSDTDVNVEVKCSGRIFRRENENGQVTVALQFSDKLRGHSNPGACC